MLFLRWTGLFAGVALTLVGGAFAQDADRDLTGVWTIRSLTPLERPELAGAFDVIGVTHDHPIAVDRTGAVHPYPADQRRTDTGFTPIANEIGELDSYLASELPDRDLVIAGHGVATADVVRTLRLALVGDQPATVHEPGERQALRLRLVLRLLARLMT